MRYLTLPTLVVLGAIFATIGCDGGPQEEPGPLPRTPAPNSLKRIRQWNGAGVAGRVKVTVWKEGDKLVTPDSRLADLRNALEAGLREQLARKQVAKLDDGRSFERPSTYVHAAVVSLKPDVAIASVAEMPVDATKIPFIDWPGALHLHTDPKKRFGAEYITCFNGNLIVSAGPIAPFKEEMYAVSGDKNVAMQRIQFAGNDATVVVQNAVVTMKRDGDAVRVVVEYR